MTIQPETPTLQIDYPNEFLFNWSGFMLITRETKGLCGAQVTSVDKIDYFEAVRKFQEARNKKADFLKVYQEGSP